MSSNLSYREKRLAELKERRAKNTGDYGPSYRLTIPESVTNYINARGLVARWVNDDEKGRVHDKTQRDTWDFLTNEEVADDPRNANPGGERIARRVGTKEDGSPLYTYLCVKPKDWYEQDAKRRSRPHEEMMAEIRERPIRTAQESDLSSDEEHAYIPSEVKLRAKGIKRKRDFETED